MATLQELKSGDWCFICCLVHNPCKMLRDSLPCDRICNFDFIDTTSCIPCGYVFVIEQRFLYNPRRCMSCMCTCPDSF